MNALREIYQYRDLLSELVVKEIKLRYKRSALGIFWSLLQPILMMAVFSLASAPAYYLMRAEEGIGGMQLPGMIVLLTGPMFLAILVSFAMSAMGWWNKR